METQVIMKRQLFSGKISQQSKTGFFNATELAQIGSEWRRAQGHTPFNLSQFLKTDSTCSFIHELENKYGDALAVTRGRNGGTWVHPLLFIDIALAINPKLKVEVYEWLFDNLIKFRNDSGDSYKEMAAAIWTRFVNKREFPKYMVRVANYIKKSCEVPDWQTATENQLKQREKIHNSIKTLTNVLTNTDDAVRLGVVENLKK